MKKQTSHKALTQDEIDFLIFGTDLLSGLESPFRNGAEKIKTYLQHESELMEIYSEQNPGRRPRIFFEQHEPRQVIGTAARVTGGMPPRVRVYQILETDAQYLLRTGLGLPHERSFIKKQAEEDSAQQAKIIENTKHLVAQGDGTILKRALTKDDSGISPSRYINKQA